MLDLRDDGTIGIDFGNSADPLVVRRPKVGALKRARAEMARIADKSVEYIAGLHVGVDIARAQDEDIDPDLLTKAQYGRMVEERYEADSLEWWAFVLRGDESFAGLAEGDVPPDEDWPGFLANPLASAYAINHWKSVPLARGGSLVQPK